MGAIIRDGDDQDCKGLFMVEMEEGLVFARDIGAQDIRFNHARRGANQSVHLLARLAQHGDTWRIWLKDYPVELSYTIRETIQSATKSSSTCRQQSRDPLQSIRVERKMGVKAKKTMKKRLKKASHQHSLSLRKDQAPDFLPLEGGPGRKIPEQKPVEPVEDKATVLYLGRIPHGFYEKEMEGFFSQFGKIKRLRIARNKKTGKSKHFGFIEFESPEVAKIVADCMHNQLLFEHLLQVHLIPTEHVHPKLWRGFNYRYKPVNWVQLERDRQDKEKSLKEHKKFLEKIRMRDLKRKKKIAAAGIDYECPEFVGGDQPAAKKIKV
nr:mki67 fha domain-interacting nucleolar phosphoprotein-like [Quercus suber]